mmetsp:Transcript_14700/g.22156  ORF Transcript_14700/g.22156 Transcript_14700/m.22156 type:complete len:191 (-) Transcript_14700:741-1313(-)
MSREALDETLRLCDVMARRQEALMLVAEQNLTEVEEILVTVNSENSFLSERIRAYVREFSDEPLSLGGVGVSEEKDESYIVRFEDAHLGFSLALTRYQSSTRVLVDKISDSCHAKNQLQLQDQVIAINGESISTSITKPEFAELIARIKSGPRPLEFTLLRRPSSDNTTKKVLSNSPEVPKLEVEANDNR